jgi:hypothetical protein
MKLISRLAWLLACVVTFEGCKKKENAPPTPPTPTIGDSTLRITAAQYKDLNEFDVQYQIAPTQGLTFSNIYLVWSNSSSFTNADSILLVSSTGTPLSGLYSLKGLKDSTTYFARLRMTYANKAVLSNVYQWTVNRFALKSINLLPIVFPYYIDRGLSLFVTTNFEGATSSPADNTKVSFGNYACTVTRDIGKTIFFDVADNIPEGRYPLRVERKGLVVQTVDSFFVSKGTWSEVNYPDLPAGLTVSQNALADYGVCTSTTKSYIIGGQFADRPPEVTGRVWQRPDFILEFDPFAKSWSKKIMPVPKYFDFPNCFYYNNSIYVIGGIEKEWTEYWKPPVKNILKLDLSTMNWTILDTIPIPPKYSQVSFELNGEWYIGLGLNFFGFGYLETPSKEFWKYNPATNVWTRLPDFPGGYQDKPTVFTANGKAYLFVGYISKAAMDPRGTNQTEFMKELWEYNPALNSWRKVDLPDEDLLLTGERYSIVAQNGKAYFFTAQKRTVGAAYYYFAIRNTFLEYDISSNSFKKIAGLTDPVIMNPIFQTSNSILFLGDRLGYTESFGRRVLEFKF